MGVGVVAALGHDGQCEHHDGHEGAVAERGQGHGAQHRVLEQVAHAVGHVVRRGLGGGRRVAGQPGQQGGRHREGGGVDPQHVERAELGDQEAGDRRADQARGRGGGLEQGVARGDDPFVQADGLGQQQALRGQVGRGDAADQGHDRRERPERQRVREVQRGHGRGERRAAQVAGDGDAAGAPAGHEQSGGHAQQGHRQDLDEEHQAHACR